MNRALIVGASVGGVKTAQALRAAGHTGQIVIVEAEAVAHPYDRPPLSKGYLAPEAALAQIALTTADELAAIDVQVRYGAAATALDPTRKLVTLEDGEQLGYDSLVIATGARARRSPWGEGPGMHVLRTSADAEALRAELLPARRLLIVGAGFIGAEIAATATKAGVTVIMVDPLPAPMSRVLNDDVGQIFGDKHNTEGVDLILGHSVSSVERADGGGFHVALTDGTRLDVDAVLVGIGAVVNTEWLEGSGLVLDNGVLCTPGLAAVGVDDIYAVGDVCRWTDATRGETIRLEHWTNATDQAPIVAHNIVNPTAQRAYEAIEYVWSDQYDWKIQVVGRTGATDHELIGAPEDGRFAVTYTADGRKLTGAVIVNWPRALVTCRRAIADGTDIASVRDSLARLAATSADARARA